MMMMVKATAQRMSNVPDDNWDDNEGDDNDNDDGEDDDDHRGDDDDDDDDDETLSERCGTDVQLLWSGLGLGSGRIGWLRWLGWQRKAQLFICTMSQKCQDGAKGAKDSLVAAGQQQQQQQQQIQLETKAIMMSTTLWQSFVHKHNRRRRRG
ncbi:GL23980 [Drosophila persimilis]|uniref:GL23980 n=1 Tax=Drosophila persimilis TaxID=7234 RepID=B4G2V7_DROPE|nr:GL23980 [Drosophila persimilis]